ncbi:protein phosphatase 2C-like protein [Natranaerovirga pectinivora]|uniref:Protein phosphatase 2C-like protein n=1 Tax=Natranaerovirga pectinivora TaxID=682400 RepID=A0A4R3MNE0_9FIRM|nr:PP2C family serine/threonine-protein phosphatase [Natranaerovirga pectinivora]TCT16020.1 protein phosphatase 2C-like protein [Natranaerovirga pectinivora]
MTINVAAAWLKGLTHSECQDKVNACRGKIYLYNHMDDCKIESDYGLVVVCDGAGSKIHSSAGAYVVAKGVEKYFTVKHQWMSFEEFNIEEIKHELLHYIIQEILSIASKDDHISDYACTLLFVLYLDRSKKYIYGHIGDGGIVALEDDSLRILSGPENGEYKNQTYFITERNAEEHFRLKVGTNISQQLGFLLCTDGIAGSLFKFSKTDPKISPVCQTFCEWLMDSETEEELVVIEKAYKDNLYKHFSSRSKDDLSLVVMTVS